MRKLLLFAAAALCLVGCNHPGTADDPTVYSVAWKSYSYTNAEDLNIRTATADELDGKILIHNSFDFFNADSVELIFSKDTIKKTSETHADLFGFADTLRCSFAQDGNTVKMSDGTHNLSASSYKDHITYNDTVYMKDKIIEL